MKHLLSILAAALLLTGCTQVSERGEQLGRQLMLAWGDTAAVKAIDDQYQAAADSLHIPGTAGHLASAFMQAVGDNDSVQAVAQAIVLSADDFADEHAKPLVNALLDGSMDARQATDRLFLLHWAADLLDKNEHIALLDRAIDDAASRLSDKDQMVLYSRAAAPQALAKQMLAERAAPGADTAAIDRRAALLGEIYDETQLKEFQSVYNQSK